ncbi:DUF1638 domain-containing protein [Acetohalobium arabaticum]|uniref:DUF1638 domain-containing protein n=1 Tax=Acetohalobium arabaticum (strain ATCC 49924 / DSM 5501 / Z-7288) TaxID=574087 RepID=D9QQD3_ACEAZ|nr:DUF1638 domain-containing protein [Acetohalobium arabaticum]ADL12724.1 hypothetical protein Acear_1204 [Acetohalobium arabaticum DSM 5501]
MKKAVISCKVLYEEIFELINGDFDVEFLPQGLHNLPNCEDMRDEIQEVIDELEAKKDYDYIILGYGLCSGGVEGLKAKEASLVIPKVHDCIPMFLGGREIKDELEKGGTYYLSRGWIDCGGDTYKRYLFLANKEEELQKWIDKFRDYQSGDSQKIVDWYQKDRYQKLAELGYPEDKARFVSFEALKNYDSITLIDNDNLDSIHYRYTEAMYNFIDDLLKEERGEGLDYQVVKGDTKILKDLLYFDELDEKNQTNLAIIPPNEGLQLEIR